MRGAQELHVALIRLELAGDLIAQNDAHKAVLRGAVCVQGQLVQDLALRPDGIQLLLRGIGGRGGLIAGVDVRDLPVQGLGSGPQLVDGGEVGGAVCPGGGGQLLIEGLLQVVAGQGQVQGQGRGLVEIDGQGAEVIEVGLHDVGGIGVPVVRQGVVAVLGPAALKAGDIDEVRHTVPAVGDAVLLGVGVHGDRSRPWG